MRANRDTRYWEQCIFVCNHDCRNSHNGNRVYTPYAETLVVLGTAFIISGAVGIYMMLATRQVARKPPERFNEQNIILHKIDADILHSLKLHGFYGYHHF